MSFFPTQRNAARLILVVLLHFSPSLYSAPSTNQPVGTREPIGFASVNGNTVGGRGGTTVTVSNAAGLRHALTAPGPRVVQVAGTIDLAGNVEPAANKTIVGLGADAALIGNLMIKGVTNVIVQNLHLGNPDATGNRDCVTLDNSSHVWIDHCTFTDSKDGQLDITHGSDYVTVSWCKFSYRANSGHNFSGLIGHSDKNAAQDAGKLHVTYHHNWWSTLCVERMPRTRFGRVHLFNNYYHSPGNNYCVRASIQSEVLVENNYFENVARPYEKFAPEGRLRTVGNETGTASRVVSFNDTIFVPPYPYTLETPAAARSNVLAGAGAGR